ncbi:MAG: hypothetical protein JWP88_726 [Flaviaesturariibacter sp.]|nr:hypothetical protein [Flaviaesturariibacter sp.]
MVYTVYLSMKKWISLFVIAALFACNNESSSEKPATTDTVTGSDSVTLTDVDTTPPPAPEADNLNTHFNQKVKRKEKPQRKVLSSRAKLDSVAIRQNNDLPFKKDN